MVIFGTPSFGPKLNLLMRSTMLATSSGEARSVDSTLHMDTEPFVSILIRINIFPRSVGSLRNSLLYIRYSAALYRSNTIWISSSVRPAASPSLSRSGRFLQARNGTFYSHKAYAAAITDTASSTTTEPTDIAVSDISADTEITDTATGTAFPLYGH